MDHGELDVRSRECAVEVGDLKQGRAAAGCCGFGGPGGTIGAGQATRARAARSSAGRPDVQTVPRVDDGVV